MKVQLIAYTTAVYPETEQHMSSDFDTLSPDFLAEFAGRACYQSFDRPNPATARNADYLANILRQSHESVLEHASVTFYVTGVSRSLSHELVRHRHLSFSQQSQRYVDESNANTVVPPTLEGRKSEMRIFSDSARGGLKDYDFLVTRLIAAGIPRKKAREAARSVLPNATETRFVVTGNLRAWRDVLRKRHHVAADAEIQQFAKLVLGHLRRVAPNSVQDINDEPFGA